MEEKPKLVKNKKITKLYKGSPTVKKLLEKTLSEAADIKKVIIITKDAEGYLGVGWSNNMLTTEAIGLLEYAKSDMVDYLKGR